MNLNGCKRIFNIHIIITTVVLDQSCHNAEYDTEDSLIITTVVLDQSCHNAEYDTVDSLASHYYCNAEAVGNS
jgi:hypothetical protein